MLLTFTIKMPSHVHTKSKKFNKSKKSVKPPKIPDEPVTEPAPATNGHAETNGKLPIVEQEIKFARSLADNDAKTRNRVLKNLKKWLNLRSKGSFAFTDADFLRLWKGLWYCMWMSDKPLTQEELCEDLAALVHCFDTFAVSCQFFGCFLQTMSREWFGIDQWRMNKFMMLVRRMLRQILFKLAANEWALDEIELFGRWLARSVYDESKTPAGLIMHFNDLYIEEISKVSEGQFEGEEAVHALIDPCVLFFAKARDLRLLKHTKRNIFYKLLMQSEMGQEYQEKFDIWKKMNFPCANLDDLEVRMQVEEEEEEEEEGEDGEDANGSDDDPEEKSLDIRAGRVDVTLYELKFDARKIMEIFEKYRFKDFTNGTSRRQIKEILLKYRKFADGEFPLGTKKIETVKEVMSKFEPFDVDAKAEELLDYEQELAETSSNLPRRIQKKLERRKRLMDELVIASDETAEETVEPKKKKSKGENGAVTNGKFVTLMKKQEKLSKMQDKKLKQEEQTPKQDKKIKDQEEQAKKQEEQTKQQDKKAKDLEKQIKKQEKKKEKKEAKSKKLVLNPASIVQSSPVVPTATDETPKRVKIVLQRNMAQDTDEYIESIKNSPMVPYDSDKKPKKGLLKPHCQPSPINPFYKKRIGLKFDTQK